MHSLHTFYIDGRWITPNGTQTMPIINPSTEQSIGSLVLGSVQDVDVAVVAARNAFETVTRHSTIIDRLGWLRSLLDIYERRRPEFAELMSLEMGAPISFSQQFQAVRGSSHLTEVIRVLESFPFTEPHGTTLRCHDPIGVCSLITPWNWPVNQMMVKVAPAIAAGCSMVLKPSEYSPLSAQFFAQIVHEAGIPKGVFNMIYGDGSSVGARMASHPDVDMVSFTGSTRAGIQVAISAADSVKRVTQELGGKSANILLDDVDLDEAVAKGVAGCFINGGQTCSAPTRMLVPSKLMRRASEIALHTARTYRVGAPSDPLVTLGPLVNARQFASVQAYIQTGIDEGARLVTGGVGRPDGIDTGYFVKPTVFADVSPEMKIAREEIFGPVLAMIPYETEAQAVDIANNTAYGLTAFVQSSNLPRARAVARQLRAGQVHINYPLPDFRAPFGGFKQSGNGREWGEYGMREYLEIKSVIGHG